MQKVFNLKIQRAEGAERNGVGRSLQTVYPSKAGIGHHVDMIEEALGMHHGCSGGNRFSTETT